MTLPYTLESLRIGELTQVKDRGMITLLGNLSPESVDGLGDQVFIRKGCDGPFVPVPLVEAQWLNLGEHYIATNDEAYLLCLAQRDSLDIPALEGVKLIVEPRQIITEFQGRGVRLDDARLVVFDNQAQIYGFEATPFGTFTEVHTFPLSE